MGESPLEEWLLRARTALKDRQYAEAIHWYQCCADTVVSNKTKGEPCQRQFLEAEGGYLRPRQWRILRPVSEVYTGVGNLARLDWDVLLAQYWADRGEDATRRRSAEALVPDEVRLQDFRRLIVLNPGLLERVAQELRDANVSLPVDYRPELRFSLGDVSSQVDDRG